MATNDSSSPPMRVLIDALPARRAGLGTYVENLVRGWTGLGTGDQLSVLLPTDSAIRLPDDPSLRVHHFPVPAPTALGQPWRQSQVIRQHVEAHAQLAVVPQVGWFGNAHPLVVVVHDLRHELRPDQFSLVQRTQRAVAYGHAYRQADAFVVPSNRTAADFQRMHPEWRTKPLAVVKHGADHVPERDAMEGRASVALAFGQTDNKNPELVIEAWSRLARSGDVPSLHITAVPPRRVAQLRERASRAGLERIVHIHDFLSGDDFTRLVDRVTLTVYPSSHEGFGLPILEAMRRRIPVVIAPDPACLEVAGGHAATSTGWSPDQLAAAVASGLAMSHEAREEAFRYASGFTWVSTARHTRAVIAQAVEHARIQKGGDR